jgi:hypothetical protein
VTESAIPSLVCVIVALAQTILLVRLYLKNERAVLRWLAGTTLFTTSLVVSIQIVGLVQLVGLVSAVGPAPFATAQGLLFLSILALTRLGRGSNLPNACSSNGAVPLFDPKCMHLAVSAGMVGLAYGAGIVRGFFAYPAGDDALMYHLPAALRPLQDGSFRLSPTTNWQFGLPMNAECLMMLLLSAGRDRWVWCAQLPALLALGLAVHDLAGRYFATPRVAWTVTLLVLSLPIVYCQAFDGYVDLFGTAFLTAALAFALDALASQRRGEAQRSRWLRVLGGLACGLAVGTKPTFWPFALLLATALVVSFVGLGIREGRFLWGEVVLLVASLLLPCGFWFGRAWAGTGNPFFPLQVSVGESVVLPGYPSSAITSFDSDCKHVRSTTEWLIYPWTEWKRATGFVRRNYTTDDGVGALYATFVPTGVLYVLAFSPSRRSNESYGVPLVTWFIVLMVLVVMWWFALRRMPRFGLPILVLSCLLSAPAFDSLESLGQRMYRLLYLGALSVTLAILGFAPLYTIGATLRNRTWSRSAFYAYPSVVDQLPAGSRILNLGDPQANFPLSGANLTNRVIAAHEAPRILTTEYLRINRVDYVVEHTNGPDSDTSSNTAPCPGLRLFGRPHTRIVDTNRLERWVIWEVEDSLHSVRN